MIKAGGILGIIGGIFGILAALATLFIGGIGSAFQANGASTVVGLGWGGVVFSMLSIICGAIAFAKPKGAGIALVVAAIAGMIGGGTLVAICMVLSLVGGVLSIMGAKKQTPAITAQVEVIHADTAGTPAAPRKISPWVWGAAGAFLLLVLIGVSSNGKSGAPDAGLPHAPAGRIDPLEELAKFPVSNIRPDGALAKIFALGGRYTDLQREDALREIKGKIISWTLPVYEVKRDGNGYKIQTRSSFRSAYVGAFINISPRDQQDRQVIESLRSGELISFRGVINDVFMRHIVIKPAILERQDVMPPVVEAPAQAPAPNEYAVESGTFTGPIIVASDREYSAMAEDVPDENHIAIYFRNNSPAANTILAACKNGQVCQVSGKYRTGTAPESAPRISSVVQDNEWVFVESAKAVQPN